MSRAPRTARFDVDAFTRAVLKTIADRCLRQEDVSLETGIYEGLLGRMRCQGRRPSVDAFLSLCAWAGLNPMDFLTSAENKTCTPSVASVFELGAKP